MNNTNLQQNEAIYNMFNKYILENNITNTAYAKAYSDFTGVVFRARLGFERLKKGVQIPLSQVYVFCQFLTEEQKNDFLNELFTFDFGELK